MRTASLIDVCDSNSALTGRSSALGYPVATADGRRVPVKQSVLNVIDSGSQAVKQTASLRVGTIGVTVACRASCTIDPIPTVRFATTFAAMGSVVKTVMGSAVDRSTHIIAPFAREDVCVAVLSVLRSDCPRPCNQNHNDCDNRPPRHWILGLSLREGRSASLPGPPASTQIIATGVVTTSARLYRASAVPTCPRRGGGIPRQHRGSGGPRPARRRTSCMETR